MAQPRVVLFQVRTAEGQFGDAVAMMLDLEGADVASQIGTAVMERLVAIPAGGSITYQASVYPVANLPELPAPGV